MQGQGIGGGRMKVEKGDKRTEQQHRNIKSKHETKRRGKRKKKGRMKEERRRDERRRKEEAIRGEATHTWR